MTVLRLTMGMMLCLSLGGCLGHREEEQASLRQEVAELVKLYRLCLQKNEENPAKAREHCALYRDAIRDLSPEGQKSIVAELLDRLRDKTR
jgi:hypothetical protein